MKRLGKLNINEEDSIIMFGCSCSCNYCNCPSCGCNCTGTSAPINGGYAATAKSSVGLSSGVSYSGHSSESEHAGR